MSSFPALIYSYPYEEYNDDDNIAAFFTSYNTIAQEYLNWFNEANLPVYSSGLVVGSLLDWVALGLYGKVRPYLTSGIATAEGPLNTYPYNVLPFNQPVTLEPTTTTPATDDVFKRVLTWAMYKGDGKHFNVKWLKRRINRFLLGVNGTDTANDETYRISVKFGLNRQVNIRILSGERIITSSALFNAGPLNAYQFNGITSAYTAYPPLPMATTFKEAVANSVLELPFGYTYVVTTS